MSVAAGLEMLERGGNAIDAAVAAGLVAGVVEPQETTLAGPGFLLMQEVGNNPVSVEFGPRAPLAARPDMYRLERGPVEGGGARQVGADEVRPLTPTVSAVVNDENTVGVLAAGVPGNLVGLITAHERFGSLDRAVVIQPAVAAAGEGFEPYPAFVLGVVSYRDLLLTDAASSSVYMPQGRMPVTPYMGRVSFGPRGRMIVNTALAETLQKIADGGLVTLQTGEVAQDLVRTVAEMGGLLSVDDFARPRVDIRSPRVLDYRQWQIATPHAPCGGISVLQMLAIWQELHGAGDQLTDAQRVRDLANISFHVFADRYHWLGDPVFAPVPDEALLTAGYVRELADLVRRGAPAPHPDNGSVFPWREFASRAVHDPWRYDAAGRSAPRWGPKSATEPVETSGTTHVSVIDRAGMAVSLTHTGGIFGDFRMCPRTGLPFDNTMNWFNAEPGAANSIRSGARPLCNMSPMLIAKQGRPFSALGAPGARRILNALVQVTINLLDRRMAVVDALAEPRVDASGANLLVMDGLKDTIAELPHDIKAQVLEESGEFLSYEMARPVLVVRTDDGFEASVHPPGPGAAAAL
jgi:gamma-glutamyltranspeptidase/glutathione hydrolase